MITESKQYIFHLLLLTLLLPTLVVASPVRFGGPDAVPNQLQKDEKSWGEFKESLAEEGLRFTVDYSAVGLNASDSLPGADDNAGGGMVRFYGQWNATEKGSLIWKVEHRHDYTDTEPKGFLFGTGTLGLAVPPFSDEKERLTNLYWKHNFNGGRTVLITGFLDATDYLDVYMLASPWTGFMNFAFSAGTTTIALPGDATLGIAAGSMINDQLFMIGGITDMNSDPTDPLEGFDNFLNDNKYFKSVEFGWTPNKDKIYTDNIHMTLWRADESDIQGTDDGHGLTISASRLIGQWLPFLRGGYSEDAGTLNEKSISVGTGYLGFGSEGSNLGVAINWAEIDGNDDQYTTELFYLIKVLPSLEIAPDIQWIHNPALNMDEDNLYVFGLRMRAAI